MARSWFDRLLSSIERCQEASGQEGTREEGTGQEAGRTRHD
jgi:hypothetical protein